MELEVFGEPANSVGKREAKSGRSLDNARNKDAKGCQALRDSLGGMAAVLRDMCVFHDVLRALPAVFRCSYQHDFDGKC